MKKILFLSFFFFHLLAVHAQEADRRVGELIGSGDWFSLDAEYPVLKDRMQSVALNKMAGVLLDYYFNRPDRALKGITDLLANHQQELSFPNITSFVLLAAHIDFSEGRYKQALESAGNFLQQVKALGVSEGLEALEAFYKSIEPFRELPAPQVCRSGKDTEVPFHWVEAGRGQLMFLPVTVHGKEYRFIFDTGASSTYFSREFAEELGVRIIQDSVSIGHAVRGQAMVAAGLLDSLSVGDVVLRNVVAYVAPPHATDSIFRVDAVLGADWYRRLGEAVIYPEKGKIVFPVRRSPVPATGRNLLLESNITKVKLFSGHEALTVCFDSGNAYASLHLFENYYKKHAAEIDRKAAPAQKATDVTVNGFPVRLGSVSLNLDPVLVSKAPQNLPSADHGACGTEFVKRCRKLIINYTDAFLQAEIK